MDFCVSRETHNEHDRLAQPIDTKATITQDLIDKGGVISVPVRMRAMRLRLRQKIRNGNTPTFSAPPCQAGSFGSSGDKRIVVADHFVES